MQRQVSTCHSLSNQIAPVKSPTFHLRFTLLLVDGRIPVLNFAWWVIFHVFSRLLIFLKPSFFKKNILSETPSECQSVRIQVRPDTLSGLIWVQTFCYGDRFVDKTRRQRVKVF